MTDEIGSSISAEIRSTFAEFLTIKGLWTMALAGACATVAFDFFGQSLSPMLGFANLAPVPLANNVIQVLFGAAYRPGAEFLHYFAGMVAYPLGWILLGRPIARAVIPSLGWVIPAAIYGVLLWIFALYVMAHLVAGNPPFLAFTGITWVALIGHVLFALIAAWAVDWRENSK
ncbi:hypothetical protein [Stappia albiluteola]|nr:hypothetical protein [Stappia albiluteola]